MNTAIIVDWALFKTNPKVQAFVSQRAHVASTVLLVTDADDALNASSSVPEIEWDVIIRNTGKRPDVMFKMNAFDVLDEVSNLTPVIAFDYSVPVNTYYRDHGVLVTLEDFE